MKIMYLRLGFHLGLKAGGSVGHTAGVIHAMSKNNTVKVISNDMLSGLREPVWYMRPWLTKGLPQSVLELLNNLQFIINLRKQEFDVNVIYQRHAPLSFAGAWFASRYGIPLVLEFNSSEAWKFKHWENGDAKGVGFLKSSYHLLFTYPMIQRVEEYNLKNASLIVVVSDALKEILLQRGIPASRILVNPNGVDDEKFHPGCGGEIVRRRYHLESKIVIGFIGTFGPWHGIKEMAHAIVLLFHRYPLMRKKLRFFLIGDGVLMSEMRRILTEGEVTDEVVLPGLIPQEMAPAYLDACDVFLSPHIGNPDGSNFFGSPTKLFEYMAMGRGIVASRLAQIGEILEHKKTAWLIEPGNIEQLMQAIVALAEDQSLCERLGQAARAKVLQSYTWDRNIERLMAAVQKI